MGITVIDLVMYFAKLKPFSAQFLYHESNYRDMCSNCIFNKWSNTANFFSAVQHQQMLYFKVVHW